MVTPDETSEISKSTFHYAFTVSNIKYMKPLILNQTDDHYASWVEFFHIHTCAYNVFDHIDPDTPRPADIDETTQKCSNTTKFGIVV